MIDSLISYLLQFGQLNMQQIELISSKVVEVKLDKDEYFSEAGKISKRVGFVTEGVLRYATTITKGTRLHVTLLMSIISPLT